MKKKSLLYLSLVVTLVIYLLVIGIGAALILMINFPNLEDGNVLFPHLDGDKPKFIPFGTIGSAASGLMMLAFLSGVAGSFLHAAQSLSSYIGNATLKLSWMVWYVLRPWIGGVLGLAIYFVFRAGLVGGGSVANVNPYGVVAVGLLGGWFSKTTTDKLQEVFETLFKTDEDKKRKDKLFESDRPQLYNIFPAPIPLSIENLILVGANFKPGATVLINRDELDADFLSDTQLAVSLASLQQQRQAGSTISIQVKNPEGNEPLSETLTAAFQ